MEPIYVIGHKNPDTDSICAAYAYAYFKREFDGTHDYIAGICGIPNDTTRYIFKRFGLSIPRMIKDLNPHVEDVMQRDLSMIQENDPILYAIEKFDKNHVRTLPVVDKDHEYQGIISIWELSEFFIPTDFVNRPHYIFRPENFPKVLPGHFIKQGESLEFEANLMVGAMSFETFLVRLSTLVEARKGETKYPVLVVGDRMDIIEYALDKPFPALILTGCTGQEKPQVKLAGFKGWVFVSEVDTAETIRILRTSTPVKSVMNPEVPKLGTKDSLKQVKVMLRDSDYRELPVIAGKKIAGLVSSSSLVDPPEKKVILVDHNEPTQAVDGIENAEIIEIIDHHRINVMKTTHPIYIYAKPVGSTCTLVYQHFKTYKVAIPKSIASILLAGILADTVILRSPTTTQEDIKAAGTLSRLSGLELTEFGKDIFSHSAQLTNADPVKVIQEDLKTYHEFAVRFGISQVEVINFADLKEMEAPYLEALERRKFEQNLDWLMLLVTDVLHEESYLFCTRFPELESLLIYDKTDEHIYHLPGVLSRKKQLLPEILRILEKRETESQ